MCLVGLIRWRISCTFQAWESILISLCSPSKSSPWFCVFLEAERTREHFEKRRWEKCKDEEEKSITVRNSTPAKPSVCQIQFTIVFNFATEWILYFMLMSWAVARNTQWIMWCNTSWVLRIFCRCEKDHLRMWGERNKIVLQMYSNIIIHSISVTKIYIYISYKVQTHS